MNQFKIIAFTHKTTGLQGLAKLYLDETSAVDKMHQLKSAFGLLEVMLISTCNRMEFLISSQESVSAPEVKKYLRLLYPSMTDEELEFYSSNALVFEGDSALNHLFNVASSMDSLVVGEREIITQVRNAYELYRKNNLSGDLIRMVIQRTVECAKQVFTQTNIARNPVSVVSLAYRKLKEFNVPLNARFLLVGAGVTNSTMAKYLCKHGFTNFSVFNRTFSKSQSLAQEIGGKAYPLDGLKNYHGGFDVIVTCTGSGGAIISQDIYRKIVGEDRSRKIVIDLAVPNDLDPSILELFDVNLIAINNLQEIARKNLSERIGELSKCQVIIEENISEFRKEFKERQVELAMSLIPQKVKEIRHAALNEVFVRDIQKLDDQSKETLNKVISYLEKKYISVPMKMAREILIEESAESPTK